LPMYEYRCTACGHSFEKIQSFSAQPEKECPKCGGELIRPVTAPALRFAGAGWYVNDYAGKGGAKTDKGDAPADGNAAAKDAKTDTKTETKSDSGGSSDKAAASPTPAPASTPASTPSSSAGS
jgi:putative FmdB family regulatory protein